MSHHLPASLLTSPVSVLLVGCGGTGAAIAGGLGYLHQSLLAFGHPHGLRITLMDGDLISPGNCVRQPFSRQEIGHAKATVLATRLIHFWGLQNVGAEPHHFTRERHLTGIDIVIGAVDTRAARAEIHAAITGSFSRVVYWLDLGNGASTGQYLLGQPENARNARAPARLPTIAEYEPKMIDPSLDDPKVPTCSAAESLSQQEPFVNQALAFQALALLGRLFRYGRIEHHGGFMNLETGETRSLWVPTPAVAAPAA